MTSSCSARDPLDRTSPIVPARGPACRGGGARTRRGECSYWACVPSKALLRPVIAISDARRVDGAREAVDGSINTAGVFGRRNRYVAHWDDTGQADWVSGIGATLIRGDGRLDGPRRVVVTKSSGESVALTARHAVVICTGSRPALPTFLASPKPGHGPIAKPPTTVRSPTGLRSSAPAASVWRWRPPGRDWAPR